MSGDNVTNFPGWERVDRSEPNKALIDGLKDALAKAESGELQTLCAAGVTDEGDMFYMRYIQPGDYIPVMGAVTVMQADNVAGYNKVCMSVESG